MTTNVRHARRVRPIALSLLVVALSGGLASAMPAQGGWRQWEVRLRDGRRLEANPLGAPDDAHLSLSVGAYDGRGRLARSLVQVVAALPLPDSLREAPAIASCEDAIVRRNGTTTLGRITLARVRWSEGVVVQRGDTVDLRNVAYLVFAAPRPAITNCPRETTWDDLDSRYPIGRHQMPRPCAANCRT